ncbi:MAG: UPF0175 family protein [Cyanobacteria bacterium J06649_11]
MGVEVTKEFLERLGMTESEFLIEMAVHFYDIGKMSLGQARKFADLDQISFQHELSKRDIEIKYEVEDLESDMRALELMDKLEELEKE